MIFKLKDQNFRFWFAVIAMGSLFWLWDWLLQCSNMYFWWMAFNKWFGLHFHFFSIVSNIFVLRFNLQLVFLSFLGNFKPCDWSMRISLIILLVLLSDKMPIRESNTAIHAQEIAYFSDLTTNCKTKMQGQKLQFLKNLLLKITKSWRKLQHLDLSSRSKLNNSLYGPSWTTLYTCAYSQLFVLPCTTTSTSLA